MGLVWKQTPEPKAWEVNNVNREQSPCSSPKKKGRIGSQDALGQGGMEASSTECINPATLPLGIAPDYMPREAQRKLPLQA